MFPDHIMFYVKNERKIIFDELHENDVSYSPLTDLWNEINYDLQ